MCGRIRECNNCYAYAANDARRDREDFPQPGGKCGVTWEQMAVANVQQVVWLVEKDGLTRVFQPVAKPGHYLVALVATDKKMEIPEETRHFCWDRHHDEYWDYHWYRQDADGFWSHKNGEDPASRLDASGVAIKNPKNCDRGLYRHFIGWFHVPHEGLRLEAPQKQPEIPLVLPQPKFR